MSTRYLLLLLIKGERIKKTNEDYSGTNDSIHTKWRFRDFVHKTVRWFVAFKKDLKGILKRFSFNILTKGYFDHNFDETAPLSYFTESLAQDFPLEIWLCRETLRFKFNYLEMRFLFNLWRLWKGSNLFQQTYVLVSSNSFCTTSNNGLFEVPPKPELRLNLCEEHFGRERTLLIQDCSSIWNELHKWIVSTNMGKSCPQTLEPVHNLFEDTHGSHVSLFK